MKQDLFRNLPSEIKLEILSRLPIRSAIKCKLVHQSWRSMIESPEFAKSYRSAPCLAVTERYKELPHLHKVYEVEDGDENLKNYCKEAFSFSFPHPLPVFPKHTSVNGLLFVPTYGSGSHDMYICNPVTREYITIPSPENVDRHNYGTYGFGVSRKSGQFKVVRIFDRLIKEEDEVKGYLRTCCQVYTLGTGLWRSIPSSNSLEYTGQAAGAFLNGNFHWLAYYNIALDDLDDSQWITCFDLETEHFTFHLPMMCSKMVTFY